MTSNLRETTRRRRARISTGLKRAALVLACALATTALAQDNKMTPIPVPAQPDAITLDTGVLPGATAPEAWHRQYNSVFARNVTVATLTPVLPSAATATGAAVIVA
ncbi:MAG TPA: hypothetical protein VN089_02215, partial [Duganella sp.]|nr:hypothetical protein [Duganella sp.]